MLYQENPLSGLLPCSRLEGAGNPQLGFLFQYVISSLSCQRKVGPVPWCGRPVGRIVINVFARAAVSIWATACWHRDARRF